jgi:pyruvate,orthophosphate dikinase
MGKPAVVGATGLTADTAAGAIRADGRALPEGTLIALDGTSGEVVLGTPRIVDAAADPRLHRLLAWADEVAGADGDGEGRDEAALLSAAHAVVRSADSRHHAT